MLLSRRSLGRACYRSSASRASQVRSVSCASRSPLPKAPPILLIWPTILRHHIVLPKRPCNARQISAVSAVLLPPAVFVGLAITLWTWKCFMMVLFQNKIIYMPFLPPNARSDTISEYTGACRGVGWKEVHIRSGDGTDIALCVAEVGNDGHGESAQNTQERVVLYFQGNASSLPPRLPDISDVLRLTTRDRGDKRSIRVRFIAVSYRGYWKSGGRPSEVGMKLDAEAALKYAVDSSSNGSPSSRHLKVVIWGQSIGCAFASHLAATMAESLSVLRDDATRARGVVLETLILETPFISASEMLKTLYPQKWLPYRYLSPFLWNRLDTVRELQRLQRAVRDSSRDSSLATRDEGEDEMYGPNIVVLEAEKDELVPREHGNEIERVCRHSSTGGSFTRYTVEGALHTQVLARPSGRMAAAKAIENIA